MFPVRELAEASRLAFRDHSATALNYGPPAGFRPLQEWLGDRRGAAAAGFLPAHLARVRAMLRERGDALINGLDRGLAGQARWSVPDGGYFLWLELPGRVRSAAVLGDAERAGGAVVAGSGFFAGGRGEKG